MTRPCEVDWLGLLYEARRESIGLILTTNDYDFALQQLYKARRVCGDPDLSDLQFRRPSPSLATEGNLLIINQHAHIIREPHDEQNRSHD
jgi:hypothetical protein